jgi:small subunit ribosomal protein S1
VVRDNAWMRLENAGFSPLLGKIVARTSSGYSVDVGVLAELSDEEVRFAGLSANALVLGKELLVRVVMLNRKRQRVVVVPHVQPPPAITALRAGDVIEGIVDRLTEEDACVRLSDTVGILHRTDLRWGSVPPPVSSVVHKGQRIRVRVIYVGSDAVTVSLKAVAPDPQEGALLRYPVRSVVKARVIMILEYGVLVELAPGIEGLWHHSTMRKDQASAASIAQRFKIGQELRLIVRGMTGLLLDVAPP